MPEEPLLENAQPARHRRAGADHDAGMAHRAIGIAIDNGGRHHDRDHEVAAGAELQEGAACRRASLRDAQRRDDLVLAAGGVAVAVEEAFDRLEARAAKARDLDLGLERQEIGDAVAGRRGGAEIAGERRAVLNLRTADLPGCRHKSIEQRRQAGADHVRPGHECADAPVPVHLLDAPEAWDGSDVEHVLVRHAAPAGPRRLVRVDVRPAGDDLNIAPGADRERFVECGGAEIGGHSAASAIAHRRAAVASGSTSPSPSSTTPQSALASSRV